MDCSEVLTIVAGEREDDLSLAESETFEAHLESCAPCRESVARAEEDLERLSALADPPLVAASAWMRVDAVVRDEARRKPGREDPFGPDPALEPPAPARLVVPPAMPVRTPRVAAPSLGRRRTALAFAACAAAVVLGSSFFAVQPPSISRDTSHLVIGPVNPPGEDDIKIEDMKAGPSYKVLKKQGVLVVTPQGD